MTREEMRKKARALLDKAVNAPRLFVGADDKAIAVSVRAVLDKTEANVFIDAVVAEHAKRE